jgi:hypothetical protein
VNLSWAAGDIFPKTKAPAFQFYPDDFVGGVADMTQAEVGAYILLLCSQWGRGSIPTDLQRAALIAKGPVTRHVMDKFPDGKNRRLENVRDNLEQYRTAQSANGAKGASKRWHSGAMATPSPTHSDTTVSPMARNSSPSPSPTPTLTLTPDSENTCAVPKPLRPRDLCFEALVEFQGATLSHLTSTERGKLNKALKDIRTADPAVTADEIKRRGDQYRSQHPEWARTAMALAGHWSEYQPRSNGASVQMKIMEPPLWRAWIDLNNPDNTLSAQEWSQIGRANQENIIKEMQAKP